MKRPDQRRRGSGRFFVPAVSTAHLWAHGPKDAKRRQPVGWVTRAGPLQTAAVVCHHAQRPVALKFGVDHCSARFCCSSQLRRDETGPACWHLSMGSPGPAQGPQFVGQLGYLGGRRSKKAAAPSWRLPSGIRSIQSSRSSRSASVSGRFRPSSTQRFTLSITAVLHHALRQDMRRACHVIMQAGGAAMPKPARGRGRPPVTCADTRARTLGEPGGNARMNGVCRSQSRRDITVGRAHAPRAEGCVNKP